MNHYSVDLASYYCGSDLASYYFSPRFFTLAQFPPLLSIVVRYCHSDNCWKVFVVLFKMVLNSIYLVILYFSHAKCYRHYTGNNALELMDDATLMLHSMDLSLYDCVNAMHDIPSGDHYAKYIEKHRSPLDVRLSRLFRNRCSSENQTAKIIAFEKVKSLYVLI